MAPQGQYMFVVYLFPIHTFDGGSLVLSNQATSDEPNNAALMLSSSAP